MEAATIAAALAAARVRIPLGDARLLLGHLLGRDRAWLEAHRDDLLDAAVAVSFDALAARCQAGEPVAYLLGRKEFYGRDFAVSPAVLIPRPETELLVETALALLAGNRAPRILDLGTGSGCLAVTLALELPAAAVTAVDVSPAALAVARQNAERLGASVRFMPSDWFDALGGERFDLVVGNPPYIAAGDSHLADLRCEPAGALVSGVDGLDAIRIIAAAAPAHLVAGGWLLLEHGYDQGAAAAALLAGAGFSSVEQRRDLAGILRLTGGVIR